MSKFSDIGPPRKYDIVLFGATGVSGQDMIKEIGTFLGMAPPEQQFSWAVAGRSKSKLIEVLAEASKKLRKDLNGIDVIIADVSDPESLREMARQCHVILNFVGPYLLYGEVVIKACIVEGTHHLDLSAEDQFLEEMQIKYHEEAKKSGSFIIGAAGCSCILSDYGSTYLEEHFDGELNSIQSCIRVFDGVKSPELHYGTYNSITLMLHRYSELKSLALKSKLYPDSGPYYEFQHKIKPKKVQYIDEVERWCVRVPFPDSRTMERTQLHKFYEQGRQPVQTQAYVQVANKMMAKAMSRAITVGIKMLRYKPVYKFARKHPRISTLGRATKDIVLHEDEKMPYSFTLVGKGWATKSEAESNQRTDPPNKQLVLQISGIDCSHDGTVIPMLQAGLTLLIERKKMRESGGVYTPGIAFAGTTLAERMHKRGITFEFLK